MSSSTTGAPRITSIVYANNSPDPAAKTAADLRADAAMRFNVPLERILFTTMTGQQMTDYTIPLETAPPKMLVQVLQNNGELTTYETTLVPSAAASSSSAV